MDAWLLGAALLGALGALAVGARLGRAAVARVRAAASWRESVRRAAEAERERALDDLEAHTAQLLRRHRLEVEIAKPAPSRILARAADVVRQHREELLSGEPNRGER